MCLRNTDLKLEVVRCSFHLRLPSIERRLGFFHRLEFLSQCTLDPIHSLLDRREPAPEATEHVEDELDLGIHFPKLLLKSLIVIVTLQIGSRKGGL
uniref:Uncharacterized protein n=1 Tax=Arundo donax TaxID=35708 RepID=A0A0A9DDK7_ARUDO